jgi:hypothetical protein
MYILFYICASHLISLILKMMIDFKNDDLIRGQKIGASLVKSTWPGESMRFTSGGISRGFNFG